MAPEPPVTLPRGTNIGGARPVEVAVNYQLWRLVVKETGWPPAVRASGGTGAALNPYFSSSGSRIKSG